MFGLGLGPVPAVHIALERAGWKLTDHRCGAA
ncbi:acetyl-CoA acetyltransferase [Paraburkholderia sp. HC6.4b]|nr:acetyl-CoA acetyltransferase [Paraburkholderia sp. HC6.4b]MBB5450564.1 acetyl-CoA acetyltransferase [Paraburkholderia sp. Kb1A]